MHHRCLTVSLALTQWMPVTLPHLPRCDHWKCLQTLPLSPGGQHHPRLRSLLCGVTSFNSWGGHAIFITLNPASGKLSLTALSNWPLSVAAQYSLHSKWSYRVCAWFRCFSHSLGSPPLAYEPHTDSKLTAGFPERGLECAHNWGSVHQTCWVNSQKRMALTPGLLPAVISISTVEGFYFLLSLLKFLRVPILDLVGAANIKIIPQIGLSFLPQPLTLYHFWSLLSPASFFKF